MQGQDKNKKDIENKLVKTFKTFRVPILIVLIILVGVVIYGQISISTIVEDCKASKSNTYANSNIQDSTIQDGMVLDSAVFKQKADVEKLVNESTQKAFDIYVSTQGVLMAIVMILITVIGIAIPMILNNGFRKTTKEWLERVVNCEKDNMDKEIKRKFDEYNQKVEAVKSKANDDIQKKFDEYNKKVDAVESKANDDIQKKFDEYNKKVDAAKNGLDDQFKNGLYEMKKETSKVVDSFEEKLENQKYEIGLNELGVSQNILIIERQTKEIEKLKDKLLKIASNHIIELKYKESLEKIKESGSKKEKIKYLVNEIENNEREYPANGFYELGKLYLEEGEYKKAIENFELAIDKNPDYAEAYQSKAEALLCQAKKESAKKEIKLKEAWKAIETAVILGIKGSVHLYEIRGKVFYELGMFEDAKKDIIACINKAKDEEKNNFNPFLEDIEQSIKNKNDARSTEEILVKNVKVRMKKIERGVFTMGGTNNDNETNSDEQPLHQVLLDEYYVSETVVTQELWESVMGDKPSNCFHGENLPVESVSWNTVQKFLSKLNDVTEDKRPKGTTFCLPTEAQWEFAARGGNKSKNYKYSGSNDVREVAWYWQNSGKEFLLGTDANWKPYTVKKNNSQTHPVMTKGKNELGLYDMSGNVWEWCQDEYELYNKEPQINPKRTREKKRDHVARGGGWFNYACTCRISYRMRFSPDSQYRNLGFRLALVSENT